MFACLQEVYYKLPNGRLGYIVMFFGIGTQTFYFIGDFSLVNSVHEIKNVSHKQTSSTSFDIILSEYINAAFPPMHDKILQNSDEVVTLRVWPLLLAFLFLFF